MKTPIPFRERKKEAIRQALLSAANGLFRKKGFDDSTIDEICEEVGVSRRTFFRYFPSKEALVFPHRTERLERFLGMLRDAPDDESPITTLRRTAFVFEPEYTAHRAQLVAQQRVIQRSPALLAKEREIDRDWEAAMAQAFRERAGPGHASELRARVLAGAAIGVIRATMRHWFAVEGKADLAALGKEALDCLERGFSPEWGPGSRSAPAAPRSSRDPRPGPR